MAYKYTGDGILKGNLTVNSGKPLDTRSVVQTLSDLYSIPLKIAYTGMIVAVVDEESIYMLKDISSITDEHGWKRIDSLDDIASYINNKFVFITQEEYNNMETHDENTFYFIKQ